MATDPLDPRFRGLRPEVVSGYLHAPEHMVAEVIDGELSLMPRPRPRHGHAALRLGRRLGPFSDPIGDDPGGWMILIEPELHLGSRPDILVPDLAGWPRSGMNEIPSEAAITLAPAWVCEVLSDHTEAMDRGRKMRIWRRESVVHVWLVSPELHTLEVYRLENARFTLVETYEGESAVQAEPFDALPLDLPALWKL